MVVRMKPDRSGVSFFACLLNCYTHRGMQGRLIRHTVLILLWLFVAVITQKLYGVASEFLGVMAAVASAALVAVIGCWVAFRFLHHQPVADFLIDVQIESSKVSWSTWSELRRSTIIVLVAMALFSAYLFACDISWQFVLRSLSILNV